MCDEAGTLPDTLETAHQLIRELMKTLAEQLRLNAKLQHQLEQLLRQRYGRKGERVDPAQLLLFAREILARAGDEVDDAPGDNLEASTPPPPDQGSESAAARTREGHGRKPLPTQLPRRRVVHDVPVDRRACPDCGAERACIGEEVREQLEYIPASLVVIQHVRPKYACPDCAAHVVIAPRLPEPIEKGTPGPGLMAYVIVNKYADHLPLYRQEGILARQGIELSRSTLCDWMAIAADLLSPITDRMLAVVLESKVVQNDDTPVKVQDHDGKGIKTGRLWATIGDHHHRYVVYRYTPDRSGAGPEAIFKGYRGYLQADAYSAYDALYTSGEILEVGCLMHARRKFYEARTSDPRRSHEALARIGLLYEVEREAREWPGAGDYDVFVAARHALRQGRSAGIFDQLHAWLESERPKVLPKSPIGEAIGYALNHWVALKRPLEAGFLELDNGACERALRPIGLGRKNWLFAGSDRGGQTAAVLMSLCTTCKDLGIDPQAYLRDVLDRVSTHPARRINELLPDRWQALHDCGVPPRP